MTKGKNEEKEKDYAKKKQDEELAEAMRQPLPIVAQAPPKQAQTEDKAQTQEQFIIQATKPTENTKKQVAAAKEKLLICLSPDGGCTPVKMDEPTAQKFCDAANALFETFNPKNREKAFTAWNLLKAGKEKEALEMVSTAAAKIKKSDYLVRLQKFPDTSVGSATGVGKLANLKSTETPKDASNTDAKTAEQGETKSPSSRS